VGRTFLSDQKLMSTPALKQTCSDRNVRATCAIVTRIFSHEKREQLLESAREAMQHAYAQYSHFKVGAALLTAKDEVFSGCNVENSSYGLSNCAERTAIFSAVAQSGPGLVIKAIAVVNDQGVPCSPCGACRQVIYEFGPDAIVIFQSANGWKETPITELLPEGFRLQ
jgi:cytidine deaminase